MSRVTVATYPTRAEAQTVAQMLTGAGLDAVVVGDDAGGALPHLTMGTGGPSVSVPAGQEYVAAELLDVDLRHGSDQPLADPELEHRDARRRRRIRYIAGAALAIIVFVIAFSIIPS